MMRPSNSENCSSRSRSAGDALMLSRITHHVSQPDQSLLTSAAADKIIEGLLHWFARNARDLPWRRTRDPYAIWVSEIMLQQTQVKTVLPYWERWMQALPTIAALARARPRKVHKLWEGLGYYTRVRNLQRAATVIQAEHGGKFPHKFEDILALPGIGRYTAGAICSIAFNEPRPILDGNVIRVLTRLFGVEDNPRTPAVNETLWSLAESLVCHASRITRPSSVGSPKEGHTSSFNQSLMELGALVCTPKAPRCGDCPLKSECIAFRTGRIDKLPNLPARGKPTRRRFAAFVAERSGRFLVRQRPEGVVNAHLWEFPNVELVCGNGDVRHFAQSILGTGPIAFEPLCTIKHSITRYRI